MAIVHDGPIRIISNELILVDWGPMTLTISVWLKGAPMVVIAAKAAITALESLKDLADFQEFIRLKSHEPPVGGPLPSVVRRAFYSSRAVSSRLTPLAAVAGATADEVSNMARDLGGDKVIVNNGGDIAIRLVASERASVGLKAPGAEEIFARLKIEGRDRIGGVASSGWSGRSLSPGVADMVTVWARNGAIADAAATHIASGTRAPGFDPAMAPARQLDHSSDLGDTRVSVKPQLMDFRQKREALNRGYNYALDLLSRKLISGCLIMLQGSRYTLDPSGSLSMADEGKDEPIT